MFSIFKFLTNVFIKNRRTYYAFLTRLGNPPFMTIHETDLPRIFHTKRYYYGLVEMTELDKLSFKSFICFYFLKKGKVF